MNLKEQMHTAATLVRALAHALDFDAIVAGGAARDWFHGRVSKDVDIFVLFGCAYKAGTYEGYARPLARGLAGLGATDLEVFSSYRDSPRVAYVIKGSYAGLDFDLIEYISHPRTPEEQVRQFDSNLNQVWLELPAGRGAALCDLRGTEDFFDVVEFRQPIRPTRSLDGEVAERIAYLGAKYPDYPTSLEVL